MTTTTEYAGLGTPDDDIIDAEVVGRGAVARQRAAELAKAGAAASGRAAARGGASLARRYWRGLATSRRSFMAYWNDVPGADDIDECEAGKREQAKASHEKRVTKNRATVVGSLGSALAWASGGLTELHRIHPGAAGWLLVVVAWLTLAALFLAAYGNVRAKLHTNGWLWPCSIGSILGAAVVAVVVRFVVGVPEPVMPGSVAVLALIWLAVAGRDGDMFGDGQAEMAPREVDAGTPNPVQAVLATRALPQDTAPVMVQPGVVYRNESAIWTATVDTMGPSAEALLPAKPRAELAARLGLSTRRCILVVDEDRGSRLHITGIVGKPWKTARSPLLSLEPVDLWGGIPWGPTIQGDLVTYQVFERNSLFGGEAGAGKSTALAGVWAAFALAVFGGTTSRIWAIDGGEVDTKPLDDFGLAAGWTTELAQGVKILTEVRDEVNRRQHLLASTRNPDGSTKRKVDAQFFAEHGLGFDLLLIDELATFTQRKGKEAEDFGDLLREINQRCRKVGVHVVLGTQSPSVDAIEADSRDVLPVRWLGRARSVDLGNKVMGKGAAGRGISPASLPTDDDSRGVGWYSAPGQAEVQMRPFGWTDADLAAICRRGVELRRGVAVHTAADEDRLLAARVAEMIRADGFTVPAGRVMLAREIAARLEMDQMQLREALGRLDVWPAKVSRPDDAGAHRQMHYTLSDLPVSRAM